MGHTLYNRVYAAGFGFKEAGLKLDVTMWVPRFTQSVKVWRNIFLILNTAVIQDFLFEDQFHSTH